MQEHGKNKYFAFLPHTLHRISENMVSAFISKNETGGFARSDEGYPSGANLRLSRLHRQNFFKHVKDRGVRSVCFLI